MSPVGHFRENLRNDTKYITAWFDVGWTNEAMSMGNLLYLALITQRTPILPPFAPVHLPPDTPLVPFGEVFDVTRLSAALHTPILEWHQVKARVEWDSIGCWAIWPTVQKEGWKGGQPRHSWSADQLKIDVSYTAIPEWAHMHEHNHAPFWKLARLGFSDGRREAAQRIPWPSTQLGLHLPPDEQVLCFDYIYYIAIEQAYEYRLDYSPSWHHVMKHAYFTDRVQQIADEALRITFGLPSDTHIPPYIALHARHGDFGESCTGHLMHPCFMPINVWHKHVQQLRVELRARGVEVERVLMTSDEEDAGWWEDVRKEGCERLDHRVLRTKERYGAWYEVWTDAVAQSRAAGFLGSKDSTMSLLAIRRIENWYGGIERMVHWDPMAEVPEREPAPLQETW